MYIPRSFRAEEQTLLHDLMRRYNFAVLITQHEGAPFATHLPFILDAERGSHGTLMTHLARANPQWRDFSAEQEVLVIFQGPHAYISPSWYEAGQNVPTWNYAVAHAYGKPRIIEEQSALRQMLAALVDTHEAMFEQPWRMELPEEYMERMTKAIVGFEIEITRLEGKLKLSQNRGVDDQRRVVEALSATADPLSRDVAALMRTNLYQEA